MEIIQQRLEQEADIDLVQTAPERDLRSNRLRQGEDARNPHGRRKCPTAGDIEEFRQPMVRVSFVLQPSEFIGPVMKLCHGTPRHRTKRTEYLSPTRAMLVVRSGRWPR